MPTIDLHPHSVMFRLKTQHELTVSLVKNPFCNTPLHVILHGSTRNKTGIPCQIQPIIAVTFSLLNALNTTKELNFLPISL